jgi:hypothetical protein
MSIPDLPRSFALVMQFFQLLKLLYRVHTSPKTVVRVANQLLLCDEALERLMNQFFAFVHVVEDLLAEYKEATVNPLICFGDMTNVGYQISVQIHDVERGVGLNAHESGNFILVLNVLKHLRQRQIRKAIGVTGQEPFLAGKMFPDRSEPLPNIGVQSGIGECDIPIVYVASKQFELSSTLRINEIV